MWGVKEGFVVKKEEETVQCRGRDVLVFMDSEGGGVLWEEIRGEVFREEGIELGKKSILLSGSDEFQGFQVIEIEYYIV